ncbi:hypothetical protein SETIT_5G278000v2 [Setaria italica]|uniref:Wall-associated receptor kinase C-terminal domain-containing protein n=1 Tax=Setaria italica TaxID=4555 RepID=A0A368R9F8_SETIT|nr:hypothetical protein SETIT_5G278000v2 [Setaria italica]
MLVVEGTCCVFSVRGYYSCGYTDLKISCQGEGASVIPVIRLGGENYTVQDISYESGIDGYKVILADSDVLVGGNCPAVRHGVTFDDVPVPGGGVAFVFTPDDHDKAQEHDLAADCKEVVSVLVKSEVLMDMARDVLKQGFELSWSRITMDQCPLCEKCSYSQNKTFLGCLCSNRKVGYPDCRPTNDESWT